MASTEELQTRASCVLAALEGWFDLPFQVHATRCDLHSLDERTRSLEATALSGAASLPPMMAPTWDSLAWRIARLRKKGVFASQSSVITGHVSDTLRYLTDGDTTVSLEQLDRVVAAAIRGCASGPGPKYEPAKITEYRDEAEHFEFLRQQTYYALGLQRCSIITPVPSTPRELYLVAMELTLKIWLKNSLPTFPPPRPVQGPSLGRPIVRPPPPAGFRIVNARASRMKRRPLARRTCTRCSRCNCRDDGSSVGSSNDSFTTSESSLSIRDHPVKRFFKFGWLRPLACWRRKEVDSGSDTSSTMSV